MRVTRSHPVHWSEKLKGSVTGRRPIASRLSSASQRSRVCAKPRYRPRAAKLPTSGTRMHSKRLVPSFRIMWPRASSVSSTVIGTCTPHLASTAWTCGLAAAAQRDQLGPVPHQLAQLPGRRRGDPRLGQPTHPQQIGQIARRRARRSSPAGTRTPSPPTGAPDAPARPLAAARRPPSTSRRWPPAPPPGIRPARAITVGQPVRVVGDPHRLQRLTRRRSSARSPTGAGADRSPRTAVPHTLRSPGASFVVGREHPQHPAGRSTRSGGPAPSSHQAVAGDCGSNGVSGLTRRA